MNEGPEVSGRDSYTVSENGDLTGAFFSAVDPEGAGITGWSLSGTDGGDFTISDESGELTFRNTPQLRGSGGLQPGQRVPGLRQGLRREILRLLQRDGDGGGRERAAGHQHRQPDRVHLPGERDGVPLHLPGRGPRAGNDYLVESRGPTGMRSFATIRRDWSTSPSANSSQLRDSGRTRTGTT